MKTHNKIISAHRKMLREARENRVNIMVDIREYKPTDIIPLAEYCPVKRPADMLGIFLEAIQKEDDINHGFSPIAIPENTRVESIKMTMASTSAFLRQIFSL